MPAGGSISNFQLEPAGCSQLKFNMDSPQKPPARIDRQPTTRSLAKLAGVSNATVSMALRNDPRISPRQRARIQKVAADAGYKSNPVIANLLVQLRSTKKTTYQSTLGIFYFEKNPTELDTVPTFREWIEGCHARAEPLGYGIDRFCRFTPDCAPKRLVEILNTRAIRGLIVIGRPENNIILPSELNPIWQRSAAIVIGYRPSQPALSYVANDQFSTTLQAVNEVVQLGYKRPGLCLDLGIDDYLEKRFSGGFCAGQLGLPEKDRLPIFFYDTFGVTPGAERGFKSWLKRNKPDVILTVHERDIGPWVKRIGLRVPQDIGLVHLDLSATTYGPSGMIEPLQWAGMRQNNELVGRAAVDMVIGQLHRNEYGVPPFQKGVLVSSTWTPGPTIRRQAAG